MRSAEFARRFRDHQEIGCEVTDIHVFIYYDNGRDVGLWCEHRRTAYGIGYILASDDADLARSCYRKSFSRWIEGERVKQRNGKSSSHLPAADP